MSKLEERESRRRASIVGNMIESRQRKLPAPEAEDGQRRKAGS